MNILFSPREFFKNIGSTYRLGLLFAVIQWGTASSFLALPLWLLQISPFAVPIIPIQPDVYYFWQTIFLLPYGILLTLLISGISLILLKTGGRLGTRFKAVFGIVSYSLFLPWIACFIWDLFLIFTNHWTFLWAMPLYILSLGAETILYAYGFHIVFGASRRRSIAIALLNSAIVIGLSVLIVR